MESFIEWRQQATEDFATLEQVEARYMKDAETLFYLTLQCKSNEKQIKESQENPNKKGETMEFLSQATCDIFKVDENVPKKEEIPKIDKETINSKIASLKKDLHDLTEQYMKEYEEFAMNNFFKKEETKQQSSKQKDAISFENEDEEVEISHEIAQLSQTIKKIKLVEDTTQGTIMKLQFLLSIEAKLRNLMNELINQAKDLLREGLWVDEYESYEPSEFSMHSEDFTII